VSLAIFSVVPPTESCALRSTQPLKVSTRDFYWGKGGRCIWLTAYHPCSVETSRKSGALSYPEPLGPPRPVAGDLYFTFNTLPSRFYGGKKWILIKKTRKKNREAEVKFLRLVARHIFKNPKSN